MSINSINTSIIGYVVLRVTSITNGAIPDTFYDVDSAVHPTAKIAHKVRNDRIAESNKTRKGKFSEVEYLVAQVSEIISIV